MKNENKISRRKGVMITINKNIEVNTQRLGAVQNFSKIVKFGTYLKKKRMLLKYWTSK